MSPSLNTIIFQAKSQGFFFDERPYKLNIIGVRNPKNTSPEKFEDEIAYFYYDDNGNINGKVVPATTSPSVYFLENPMVSSGAAILKQGQYKDAYSIGLHRGLYEALVQSKPVEVIRDKDRNAIINFLAPTQKGLFGINIHRATIGKDDTSVIGWDSAGCQTFQNIPDFNDMMKMAKKSRDLYGNTFTYTLIDQKQVYTNYTMVAGLAIAIALYIRYLKKKNIF
jgi:hypothetical protein